MRLSILATLTLGAALFSTAVSAAVVPPRIPTPNKPSAAIITTCGDSLSMLRTVRMDEVMDVDFDNTVVIRPVCLEDHLSGNASGLRGIIGRNDVMSEALYADGYQASDVVGIQFGADGVVLLYVMQ